MAKSRQGESRKGEVKFYSAFSLKNKACCAKSEAKIHPRAKTYLHPSALGTLAHFHQYIEASENFHYLGHSFAFNQYVSTDHL